MSRRLTRKGDILNFIKQRPRRWTDIALKFGASGHIANLCNQMIRDGIIYKPERGIYEVRPEYLKSRKAK
jgi:hypothetical protein